MTFTENWFPTQSQTALHGLVERVRRVDGLIIEIGSWEGLSSIAIANAAYPRRVECCDTWEGSPGEISAELAAERDVFATWQANIDELTAGNVTAHRMGWRDYLPTVSEPVALCFIDAEHTYIEVADAIRAVLPLLADGGIICGDDAHHPPVKQAVLDELGTEHTYVTATLWVWQKKLPWRQPLTNLYRRLCRTPSDVHEHLPVFADLVAELNAQHVIELGTRSGVSTVAWLHALADTGGRLTSVDIDVRPPIGDWPHCTFIQSDDTDPDLIG